jgi:hypothetical protein
MFSSTEISGILISVIAVVIVELELSIARW